MHSKTTPETGFFITAEQFAAAPAEVRRWLQQSFPAASQDEAAFVVERNGFLTSGDGLAILSGLETKAMLRTLANDYVACQVFFELGCDFYNPATGERRYYPLDALDFIRHTDAADTIELQRCLDTINAALREIRNDRAATIYRCEAHDQLHVHATTQHRIYEFWRRIVGLPSPHHAVMSAPGADHRPVADHHGTLKRAS